MGRRHEVARHHRVGWLTDYIEDCYCSIGGNHGDDVNTDTTESVQLPPTEDNRANVISVVTRPGTYKIHASHSLVLEFEFTPSDEFKLMQVEVTYKPIAGNSAEGSTDA